MTGKAIVPFDGSAFALPAAFGNVTDNELDALASGIMSGFGVLSFRGKVWRIKFKGEETIVRNKDGDPQQRLNVIIVGVNPNVSKTYYSGAYDSGSTEAPDCYSNDGIRPAPGVSSPQCDLCMNCPKNQFGSRTLDNGKKAKACSDNKRLAIVPAEDIENAANGGPVLLRIPPASLPELAALGAKLKAARAPFYAAIVSIGFDAESEYPRITFKPVALIQSPEMAKRVLEQRDSAVTASIISGTAVDMSERTIAAEQAAKAELPKAEPAAPKARKPAAPKPATVVEPEPQGGLLAGLEDVGEEVQEEVQEEAPKPAAPKAAAPKVAAPAAEESLSDLLAGL